MEFFWGEAFIFTKCFRCKPIFFRGMTQFFRGKPYFTEVFRGECNFRQSSGVRRKGKSSTGGAPILNVIALYQERIKGAEKASPIHTLFHR